VIVEDYVTCKEFDDAFGMSGGIVEQVNADMGTFVFLEENNTVETYGKFCTRKASENRCVIFYHSSDTE